jgi:hypothetical protein
MRAPSRRSSPALLSDEEALGTRLQAVPSTRGGDLTVILDVPRPPLATVLRFPAPLRSLAATRP